MTTKTPKKCVKFAGHNHGKLSWLQRQLFFRSHLRIEEDGRLRVNGGSGGVGAPAIPARGGSSHSRGTPEEQRRIRKYEAEIAKRALDESRKQRENEFLRHSIRNSQKMRALKEQQKHQQVSQKIF